MASDLQVVVFIILLFATIFASGWQACEMWCSDIIPVVKGEDDDKGN